MGFYHPLGLDHPWLFFWTWILMRDLAVMQIGCESDLKCTAEEILPTCSWRTQSVVITTNPTCYTTISLIALQLSHIERRNNPTWSIRQSDIIWSLSQWQLAWTFSSKSTIDQHLRKYFHRDAAPLFMLSSWVLALRWRPWKRIFVASLVLSPIQPPILAYPSQIPNHPAAIMSTR